MPDTTFQNQMETLTRFARVIPAEAVCALWDHSSTDSGLAQATRRHLLADAPLPPEMHPRILAAAPAFDADMFQALFGRLGLPHELLASVATHVPTKSWAAVLATLSAIPAPVARAAFVATRHWPVRAVLARRALHQLEPEQALQLVTDSMRKDYLELQIGEAVDVFGPDWAKQVLTLRPINSAVVSAISEFDVDPAALALAARNAVETDPDMAALHQPGGNNQAAAVNALERFAGDVLHPTRSASAEIAAFSQYCHALVRTATTGGPWPFRPSARNFPPKPLPAGATGPIVRNAPLHVLAASPDPAVLLGVVRALLRGTTAFDMSAAVLLRNPKLNSDLLERLLSEIVAQSDKVDLPGTRTVPVQMVHGDNPAVQSAWAEAFPEQVLDTRGWAGFPGHTQSELLQRWLAYSRAADAICQAKGLAALDAALRAGVDDPHLMMLPLTFLLEMKGREWTLDMRRCLSEQILRVVTAHLEGSPAHWATFVAILAQDADSAERTLGEVLDTIEMLHATARA